MGKNMDVEDANASPGEIGHLVVSSFQSSREFEFGEHKKNMSVEKANLVELASIQVRDAFQQQGRDICENELKSIAAMQPQPRAQGCRKYSWRNPREN